VAPSLIIIGAAKAATTALWSTLREHPEVFFPAQKETNYLLGGRWSREGPDWYESLFAPGASVRHRGEASPSYSMFPMFRGVPERAAALAPDARIIYMIRSPVRRMVSHWAQATAAGHEHRPLTEAVVWGSPYYFSSCYGLQLSRWAKAFPPDALLVVRSEDLAEAPGNTLDRVLHHLGLDPGWRPHDVNRRVNALDSKLRVPRPVRRVSGVLRGAGLERAAVGLAKRTPVKKRIGLVRPFPRSELELPREIEDALTDCFRSDFRLLRELVGGDLDLYDLA
jgi:hypothetical protein